MRITIHYMLERRDKMISMDRNISPRSPLSEEDIINVVKETNIAQYPEEELAKFKSLYANVNNFNPDNIEVANGSDEWIQKIIMTLGKNGVMSVNPDFGMYKTYANQVGCRYYSVPSRNDYSFDYEQVVNEIKSKKPSVFFISNPHNPTGMLLPSYFILDLADTMKSIGGYLVIDEAYGEYAIDRKIPAGEHVIVIRTMSKIYGLAGLRIGVAIAQGKTYDAITRINHPYPLNSVTLNLGSAVLSDKVRLEKWFSYQKELQQQLAESFEQVRRHVKIKPTQTNFVFVYGDKVKDLHAYLFKNGFEGRVYKDIDNAARFSIIDEDDYPKLQSVIKQWGELNDNI